MESVTVARTPNGWWEIRGPGDRVIARYVSEFQAREAGRIAAERLKTDVVFQTGPGQSERIAYREPRAVADADPLEGAPRRELILLVEDLLDARELYAQYLNYDGYSVVTAINGHEAVRLARLLRPDLILMDIRMPGMDGLEATTDLKADPDLAHIPIVAITADSSTGLSDKALAAGCTSFLSKPVLPDDVAREIRRVLDRAPMQRT